MKCCKSVVFVFFHFHKTIKTMFTGIEVRLYLNKNLTQKKSGVEQMSGRHRPSDLVILYLPDISAFRPCEASVDAAAQGLLRRCCSHPPGESQITAPNSDEDTFESEQTVMNKQSLTPCPKALVKAPFPPWLVLKNWWVKCWAMKANIRLVP